MSERDEKDARIKELEVSLEGARFDLKYQMWSKNQASAFADKLGITIGKLRARLAAKDAEIAELKRTQTGEATK